MNEGRGRALSVVLGVVVLLGVLLAIVVSIGGGSGGGATTTVHGLIGSEKESFFKDQRVVDELRRNGLTVQFDTAGSREIATRFDLSKYDFAFPAGVPAAERIRQDRHVATTYSPFYTPMAVATWRPIVDLLTAAGVMHTDAGGQVMFDMAAYLKLVQADTRWSDLPGNTAYPVGKSVLITSTDVRKSNSAAMYLGLASYVANGGSVVSDDAAIDRVMPVVEPLFLRQGFVENSSEAPFDDYLVQGIGKAPMVMIYEAQYIARAAAQDGAIRPDMVLAYPDPTIFSKHTLVPLTDAGKRLGELLTTNATLQQLAVEYGFRTADAKAFADYTAAHGVSAPATILSVIEPPTYEVLERMITRLEAAYGGPLGASPLPMASGVATP
jgi:hypothetical protein